MKNITLNKKQVEQLLSLFNEVDTIDADIELVTDSTNGIGVATLARYVDSELRIRQLDITDYSKW